MLSRAQNMSSSLEANKPTEAPQLIPLSSFIHLSISSTTLPNPLITTATYFIDFMFQIFASSNRKGLNFF